MSDAARVGMLACSGECRASGTLSRVATRLVRDEYRADCTATLCLPLFLAGDEDERSFAREFPTITIDGCAKRCALIATEKHSGPVADSMVVEELTQVPPTLSRREPHGEALELARRLAEEIARRVDRVLANTTRHKEADQ